LTAEKLTDLAVIPAIFIVQMLVSYLVSIGVSNAFGFAKRPANFVTAMGVFGNSNSLPISLVISLSQTLKGLHWDQIPGDNDEEVAARGILYLLIFQQLGQLVRWSWGYHVLLAPAEEREDPNAEAIEEGRYRDNMGNDQPIAGLDGPPDFHTAIYQPPAGLHESRSSASFDSGGRTPVDGQYIEGIDVEDIDDNSSDSAKKPLLSSQYGGDTVGHQEEPEDNLTFFPSIRTTMARKRDNLPSGVRGWPKLVWVYIGYEMQVFTTKTQKASSSLFKKLPLRLQTALKASGAVTRRFFHGLWEFMNPPLWAMLFAVIIASVPSLQRLFFEEGSFIANSATRAVAQSGGVAVPLILVVLGANLARNTLPKAALDADSEENKIGTKLLIASLISRMLLPTLIMAPILALVAKYVPVSIVDDPIFVIVCFLLTGAPSALQLAQICQINGVYEGVMSKILFQSYVIW
jgi:predicted permease